MSSDNSKSMKVIILGATGAIGTAIVDELLANDHEVFTLARSDASELLLKQKSVQVIRGDLRTPERWVDCIAQMDALVQVAATFEDDMGLVDRVLLKAIIQAAQTRSNPLRLIYTGGCWLYGQTGDRVASEESALNPIAAFSWMQDNSQLALNSAHLATLIVHPGMVYHRNGGAIEQFIGEAKNQNPIQIWGSKDVRWPVIHRSDLAVAYRMVLENGQAGEAYNVCQKSSVRVGDVADVIATRFDSKQKHQVLSVDQAVAEHGDWAVGPTLDQQMSSNKIMQQLGWYPGVDNMLTEIG